MKPRLALLLLLLPALAQAKSASHSRELQSLFSFSAALAENLQVNVEELELDKEGQRTMEELETFARENPEEFRRLYRDPEGPPPSPPPYCEDPSSPGPAPGRPTAPYEDDDSRLIPKNGRCAPIDGKIVRGCCLMYVRMKLGLPSLGEHAVGAGAGLERHGYCNRMGKYSAESAPPGAVLVYRGGPSGHIELKTAPSRYYFGPTNEAPATTWVKVKRHLVGIYEKCGS